MTEYQQAKRTSNLDAMREYLKRTEAKYGPDSFATRMLRAEIGRWERALKEGPSTLAEHYLFGPGSSIGGRG